MTHACIATTELAIRSLIDELSARDVRDAMQRVHGERSRLPSGVTAAREMMALYGAANDLVCEPSLGLYVGQRLITQRRGMLSRLLRAPGTLREVSQTLERHGPRVMGGIAWSLEEGGVYARLCFATESGRGDGQRMLAEVCALLGASLCSQIASEPPLRVHFEHERPPYHAAVERVLGCPVWYSQCVNGIVMPMRHLECERRTTPASVYPLSPVVRARDAKAG